MCSKIRKYASIQEALTKLLGLFYIRSALYLLQQLRNVGKVPTRSAADHSINRQLLSNNACPVHPCLTLNDGHSIPQLVFGLYQVATKECEEVVINAIKAGYRHLDCASFYQNEAAVGRAIAKCGVSRSELFICSKVWNDAQKEGRMGVRRSFEQSLRDLNCEYLDLYLIHWPVPGCHTESYKELELLHREGKVRSIGLSNYCDEVGKERVL